MKKMRCIETTIFVAVFILAASLGADSTMFMVEDLEERLAEIYEGNIVTLRASYLANKQRYDEDGLPQHSTDIGPWTTHARIYISSIRVKRSSYDLRGLRIYVGFESITLKETLFRSKRRLKIRITTEKDSKSVADFEKRFENVFIPSNAALAGFLPDYWKPFVSGEIAGRARYMSETLRPMEDRARTKKEAAQHRKLVKQVEKWAKEDPRIREMAEQAKVIMREALAARKKWNPEIREPECLYCPSPFYPEGDMARPTARLELYVELSRDGKVQYVTASREEAVIPISLLKVVRHWSFKPLTLDGKVWESSVLIAWEPEQFLEPTVVYLDSSSDLSGYLDPKCTNPRALGTTPAKVEFDVVGIVTVSALVTSNGEVRVLQIIKPLGFGLDDLFVKFVNQQQCEPAQYQGRPITTTTTPSFLFTSHLEIWYSEK